MQGIAMDDRRGHPRTAVSLPARIFADERLMLNIYKPKADTQA